MWFKATLSVSECMHGCLSLLLLSLTSGLMKTSFMFLGGLLERDLGLGILIDSTGRTFKDNEKALEKAEQRLN